MSGKHSTDGLPPGHLGHGRRLGVDFSLGAPSAELRAYLDKGYHVSVDGRLVVYAWPASEPSRCERVLCWSDNRAAYLP